jgi:hypothetical protein
MLEPDFHHCLEVLFGILERPNATVYEEALLTLAGLYLHLNKLFRLDHIHAMASIAREALMSQSPGMVNSASILIAGLFHFSGAHLAEHFLEFFTIEERLLRQHPEMRNVHPFIVKAVADMFEGVGKDHEVIAGLEERLFSLMKMLRAVDIDVRSEEDVAYANALFEYVCYLYKVYAIVYYTNEDRDPGLEVRQREKAVLNEMGELASVLLKLRTLNEHVLVQYIDMTVEFAKHCSRRNNVSLNKACVHKVLDMALNSAHKPWLVAKARNASRTLKSR